MRPPLGYRLRIAARRTLAARFQRRQLAALGSGSFIESPDLILGHHNISIGAGTVIRRGARIEAHQRLPGRVPRLTIGSDTNIEQNVHIICHSRVTIGDHVSITGNCAIVDVNHPTHTGVVKIGDAITDEDSFVEIGDGVFVGYGSVILPNVRIGAGAVIGANSVVAGDIPAGMIAAGSPARVIRVRPEPGADRGG